MEKSKLKETVNPIAKELMKTFLNIKKKTDSRQEVDFDITVALEKNIKNLLEVSIKCLEKHKDRSTLNPCREVLKIIAANKKCREVINNIIDNLSGFYTTNKDNIKRVLLLESMLPDSMDRMMNFLKIKNEVKKEESSSMIKIPNKRHKVLINIPKEEVAKLIGYMHESIYEDIIDEYKRKVRCIRDCNRNIKEGLKEFESKEKMRNHHIVKMKKIKYSQEAQKSKEAVEALEQEKKSPMTLAYALRDVFWKHLELKKEITPYEGELSLEEEKSWVLATVKMYALGSIGRRVAEGKHSRKIENNASLGHVLLHISEENNNKKYVIDGVVKDMTELLRSKKGSVLRHYYSPSDILSAILLLCEKADYKEKIEEMLKEYKVVKKGLGRKKYVRILGVDIEKSEEIDGIVDKMKEFSGYTINSEKKEEREKKKKKKFTLFSPLKSLTPNSTIKSLLEASGSEGNDGGHVKKYSKRNSQELEKGL